MNQWKKEKAREKWAKAANTQLTESQKTSRHGKPGAGLGASVSARVGRTLGPTSLMDCEVGHVSARAAGDLLGKALRGQDSNAGEGSTRGRAHGERARYIRAERLSTSEQTAGNGGEAVLSEVSRTFHCASVCLLSIS